jgi:predicted YcjX-like family ATPase
MSEEEQNNINQYLQNISKQFEEILQRMQADEHKLEHIHRCWSEYNHAVELSQPWLVEAERLLKQGEIEQCKVTVFMTYILSIRHCPYWTSRENSVSIQLIELTHINKFNLV